MAVIQKKPMPRQKSLSLAEAAQGKIYDRSEMLRGSSAAMRIYKKALYQEKLKKTSLSRIGASKAYLTPKPSLYLDSL
jgi:hypothetical protein